MSEVKKYRKKPVEIEAMHWDGTYTSACEVVRWVNENDGEAKCFNVNMFIGQPSLHVKTLNGVVDVTPQGYVIRGLAGEFYPHAPDPLWSQAYELVED